VPVVACLLDDNMSLYDLWNESERSNVKVTFATYIFALNLQDTVVGDASEGKGNR
jgi:hypothetical protein